MLLSGGKTKLINMQAGGAAGAAEKCKIKMKCLSMVRKLTVGEASSKLGLPTNYIVNKLMVCFF